MVLARAGHGLGAAGFGLALLGVSCATGTAPVRLAQPTPIAAGFVLDFSDLRKPEVPPAGFVEGVGTALSDRNLLVKPVGPGEVFGSLRETGARMSHLATLAQGADFLLLCETRAAFFSQLNGKYKWQVFAKLSVARTAEPAKALSAEVEFPALLDFDHEREAEALLAVVKVLAYRAGQVADRVIATPAAPAAPAAPEVKGAAGSGGGAGGGVGRPSKVVVPRPPDDLVYFVMVDRFFNGDHKNDGAVDAGDAAAFHGGDLQGVIEKLDYLQGLGVKTVWLSPVFKMRTAKFHGFGAFHGYWVEDLGKVEPRFGTLETLRKLSDALHARRMRLVLDFVVNHVGPDAPLAREKPEWFHHNGAIRDWEDARQLTDFDVHGLPDLAQEREDVYAYLLEKAQYWIDAVRPDGFRLDAVKHVPLAFWRRFNRDVKAYAGADFWMLGEVLDGRPSVLARYMREGAFDALFDFPVAFALKDVFCKGAHMGRLASVLSEDRVYDDPSKLVTLLDNHDLPRIASECRAESRRDAFTALSMIRGTPSITYGTEDRLTGTGEAETRADKPWPPRNQFPFHMFFAGRVQLTGRAVVTALSRDVAIWESQSRLRGTVATALERGKVPTRALLEPGEGRGQLVRGRRLVVWNVTSPSGAAAARIVGSGAELSDWDGRAGVRLSSKDGAWVGSAELPVGHAFAYKVVSQQGAVVTWEPGDNHYVYVQQGKGPLALRVTWGRPEEPS